jgi:2-dehydropantoate 2-reductase
MNTQRILIEGIGGIGGVVAAKLIQAGYQPTLVTNNPAITEAINRDGLRLTTPDGAAAVPAQALTSLDGVPQDAAFDAAYLIMKADGVVDAARSTVPLLKPDGYVVTLQNGVVEDAVADAIGKQRAVSGIIGWGGTMPAPGVYVKTTGGNTVVGELDGQVSGRVESLAKALETSAPVVISRNIRGALWSKLAINCAITTPCALTGDTLSVIAQDRRIRRVVLLTYREAVDTAEALGIHLERIATHPKRLYLPHNVGRLTALWKDLLVQLAGRRYGRAKPSMLQSLERGRKTEIDYLNGYVVEQAKRAGVSTPVNAALVRMIKEIELGERSIDRKNLDDLLAQVE